MSLKFCFSLVCVINYFFLLSMWTWGICDCAKQSENARTGAKIHHQHSHHLQMHWRGPLHRDHCLRGITLLTCEKRDGVRSKRFDVWIVAASLQRNEVVFSVCRGIITLLAVWVSYHLPCVSLSHPAESLILMFSVFLLLTYFEMSFPIYSMCWCEDFFCYSQLHWKCSLLKKQR